MYYDSLASTQFPVYLYKLYLKRFIVWLTNQYCHIFIYILLYGSVKRLFFHV